MKDSFFKGPGSTLMSDFFVGLNVINRLMTAGFEEHECDELDCISYNVNLDYVITFIEKYDVKINIYSNSEKIIYNKKNRDQIIELYNNKKLQFHHFSENRGIIHAKVYRFKRTGEVALFAIGSSNFSNASNNNIEALVVLHDEQLYENIWNNFMLTRNVLNIELDNDLPETLEEKFDDLFEFDSTLLNDLWLHQQQILSWLSQKPNAIINIPPGTGKTLIALRYMQHIFKNDDSVTGIVLVPTTALIDQWMTVLSSEKFRCIEMKNDLKNLGTYFPNPKNKIIITLYSRFYTLYKQFYNKLRIMRPNIMLIYDECHHLYNNISAMEDFLNNISKYKGNIYKIALSATIDTFDITKKEAFISHLGGNKNQFEISLPSFYSKWNDVNTHLILKPIDYLPLKYNLSTEEYEEFQSYSRRIAAQMNMRNVEGQYEGTAAIQRARWLRSLRGGIRVLESYIISHMELFNENSTIIFVQTNEIAENLQKLLTSQPVWKRRASIYIYDYTKSDDFKEEALKEFKKNLGFGLISERMLAEGFDLPKIDSVILHGSYRSERDWIQKIGRAIRYNPKDPDSIAKVIDVVFCDESGNPLPLEQERYDVLKSISR